MSVKHISNHFMHRYQAYLSTCQTPLSIQVHTQETSAYLLAWTFFLRIALAAR